MININNGRIKKMNMEVLQNISDSRFVIQNATNSLYLTGQIAERGFLVQDVKLRDFTLQQWQFIPIASERPGNQYTILNVGTNPQLVIGLNLPMQDPGPITMRLRDDNDTSLRWFVNVYEDDRTQVNFVNFITGWVIANRGGDDRRRNNQVLNAFDGGNNQRFRLIRL